MDINKISSSSYFYLIFSPICSLVNYQQPLVYHTTATYRRDWMLTHDCGKTMKPHSASQYNVTHQEDSSVCPLSHTRAHSWQLLADSCNSDNYTGSWLCNHWDSYSQSSKQWPVLIVIVGTVLISALLSNLLFFSRWLIVLHFLHPWGDRIQKCAMS